MVHSNMTLTIKDTPASATAVYSGLDLAMMCELLWFYSLREMATYV
jgi:hypothetical protein